MRTLEAYQKEEGEWYGDFAEEHKRFVDLRLEPPEPSPELFDAKSCYEPVRPSTRPRRDFQLYERILKRRRVVNRVKSLGAINQEARRAAVVRELEREGLEDNPFWVQRQIEVQGGRGLAQMGVLDALLSFGRDAVRYVRKAAESDDPWIPPSATGRWWEVDVCPGHKGRLAELFAGAAMRLGECVFLDVRLLAPSTDGNVAADVEIGGELIGWLRRSHDWPPGVLAMTVEESEATPVRARLSRGWEQHPYLLEVELPEALQPDIA